MALVVKDRVKVTTTTTGTGTITLGSAASGFQDFSVIGNANQTYYTIVGGSEWEVGIGTYTASGTTLSRDTVLDSSNSGSKVNFSAGSKDVFVVYPAGRSVMTDFEQTISNKTVITTTQTALQYATSNLPSIKPTLLLDFANVKALDPRITFTRASSATYFDQFGVLQTAASGVARFDHNPTTFESLGLLIEEQRTNLLTYSEQFDNAAWTKSNATISQDAAVSPDGTTDADKIVENTTNGVHDVRRIVSASASTAYTQSIFVKASGRTRGQIQMFGNSGGSTVDFDLTAGTATAAGSYGGWTSASATITNYGNGWFRVTNTATTNTGLTSLTAAYLLADASGSGPYTGDGTSGMFYWGAQLEVGAFPTSYIPTVASQVTRSADAASMTGANFSSWYRADEGTLFVNATTPPKLSTFPSIAALSDGTTNNRAFFYGFTTGLYFGITVGGVSQGQASSTFTPTVGSQVLLAAAIKLNDFSISRDGILGSADTSATVPVVNSLYIGGSATGGATLNGTIRKLAYYPIRCTNAQLQALTS